jgi:hypothetical protein
MLNQVEYYRHPAVRRRIRDFVRDASYIVGYGESELWRGNERGFYCAPPHGLDVMLDRGLDVLTCMQQRGCSMTLFDMEYYYPKYPGEAHINPARVYRLLEPVYRAVLRVLHRYHMPVMAVVTGQGYHFWTRMPFGPKHRAIEAIARVEPEVEAMYRHKRVPMTAGRGFAGFRRLQLFLVAEVLKEIGRMRRAGKKIIPVNFSDIQQPHGNEAVSIDITTYGDPIHMRDARVPFSCYQKHKVVADKVGRDNAAKIPVGVLIPRLVPNGKPLTLKRCLHLRRHFRDASRLAEVTDTRLPDASDAWMRVLADYRNSKIGAFYHFFDAGPLKPPAFKYSHFPPCIRHALRPDQLLEPTQAMSVVRVLERIGFHPKQIAEMFTRIYRKTPFGRYSPQSRAWFWVQSYCALIHAGVDQKRDLTCQKHQERGKCVQPNCGWSLANYK